MRKTNRFSVILILIVILFMTTIACVGPEEVQNGTVGQGAVQDIAEDVIDQMNDGKNGGIIRDILGK